MIYSACLAAIVTGWFKEADHAATGVELLQFRQRVPPAAGAAGRYPTDNKHPI